MADKINQIKATNTKNAESTENTDEKNTFFKSVCKEIGGKIRCTKKAQFGDTHDGNPFCLETYWSWTDKGSVKFNQFTSIDTQQEARKIDTEKREILNYSDSRTKEGFEKLKEGYINLAHRLEELISKNEYPECKKIVEKELAEGL